MVAAAVAGTTAGTAVNTGIQRDGSLLTAHDKKKLLFIG